MNPCVIINGMFRSGTTHLWKLLAADPAFERSYCEPLHPELPEQARIWPHYASYISHPAVADHWTADFSGSRLRLAANDEYPQLENYLRRLLLPGTLAKFVRTCLRLDWLAERFPTAVVVNLVRDPRAVCYSMLKHPGKDVARHDLDWNGWHAKEYFSKYRALPEYAERLHRLEVEPPYIKILALWRINVEASARSMATSLGGRGITIRYEDVCHDARAEMHNIYEVIGREMPAEVMAANQSPQSDGGPQRKWQKATTTEWVEQFKQVDPAIWQQGIQVAGLSRLMNEFGYESVRGPAYAAAG